MCKIKESHFPIALCIRAALKLAAVWSRRGRVIPVDPRPALTGYYGLLAEGQ